MAAKLQCEICGGKLIGKPGGFFECTICGTEYSTEWAREKLNGITADRNVQNPNMNTVNTCATMPIITVENSKKDNYLKLGKMALSEEEWAKAKKHYEAALSYEAECAEAYLGLLLADSKLRSIQEIAEWKDVKQINDLVVIPAYKKFFAFSSPDQKLELINLLEIAQKNADKLQQERERLVPILAARRKQILPARGLLYVGNIIACAKPDGTVEAYYKRTRTHSYEKVHTIANWTGIDSIAIGHKHILGLKQDGTVNGCFLNQDSADLFNEGQCEVDEWANITAISAGEYFTVGLRSEGTVTFSGISNLQERERLLREVSSWAEVVSIATSHNELSSIIAGIKRDGSVVVAGNKYLKEKVSNWCNLVEIAVKGTKDAVGLKADGTIIATDVHDMRRTHDWSNIVSIAVSSSVGPWHIVGLKADGTVLAVGDNDDGQCEVRDWTNVVAIHTGSNYTVGIRSDGTLLSTSYDNELNQILKNWRLFDNIDTINQYRRESEAIARKKQEENPCLPLNIPQQPDKIAMVTECLSELGYQQDEIARALNGLDTKHYSVEMLVRLGLRALIEG